jgi:hypothetical protein
MLRSFCFALVFAGTLAIAHSASFAATACEDLQTVASATEQVATSDSDCEASSDVMEPEWTETDPDFIPVGFGWG